MKLEAPKIAFIIVLLIITSLGVCPAVSAVQAPFSESKGIEITIVDEKGRQVPLYKDSYALIIGVSDYTNGWPDLENIPSELAPLETTLKYNGFNVRKILNPDSDQLKEAFEDFIDQYGFDLDNRLLFIFSGHGYTRIGGRKGYLVPADAPDPRYDEKEFVRKALDMSQIMAWCRKIEAKHALFIFDSCFSGTIFKTKDLPEYPPHISAYTASPVRQFITAGNAGEKVPAQSIFTPLLLRGIQGEADLDQDGYVTGTELGMYLNRRVLYYDRGQTPQYGKMKDPFYDEGDFVFRVANFGSAADERRHLRSSLSVQCNVPGAVVKIDRASIGVTPLKDAKVPSGQMTVEVEKYGYDLYRKRISIDPGRNVTLKVVLEKMTRRKARLFVQTIPSEATVRILNITPKFFQGMELEPDLYHLEVMASGHEVWKQSIELREGEDMKLDVKLKRTSEPSLSVGTKSYEIFEINGVSFKMIRIAPGQFMMGSRKYEWRRRNGERQHEVRISKPYWIGETEVTQMLWNAVMQNSPPRYEGCGENCPVGTISWKECREFVEELNKLNKEGTFRLPTEAEWEYACRSGTKSPFSYGDCLNTDQANYNGKYFYDFGDCRKGQTTDGPVSVGSLKPNPWGLYDMHGNVAEWCRDWHADYPSGFVNDPEGPASGDFKVVRGGSWNSSARDCRSASRNRGPPDRHGYGLRLVWYN